MGFLSIISWIIFGLIIGALGRLLVPGRQPIGWLATIALGVLGSFVGGFMKFLLWGGEALQPSGILMSIIGAVTLVLIGTAVSREKRSA